MLCSRGVGVIECNNREKRCDARRRRARFWLGGGHAQASRTCRFVSHRNCPAGRPQRRTGHGGAGDRILESFDTQALSGRGPDINAVYLPGVAAPTAAQLKTAQEKYATDLNEVMAASAARYAIEVVTAAGEMPTAAQTKALADALKKATDSGALDRVSTLQFTIMKKFFPNKAGDGIDIAKVQWR